MIPGGLPTAWKDGLRLANQRMRHMAVLVAMVFLGAMAFMLLFEVLKECWAPHWSKWESHVATILFSGAVAAALSYLVIWRMRALQDAVSREAARRGQMEAVLQEQKQVLTDILEANLSGYWDWNILLASEYLSPAFKRMFGYEDAELPNAPQTWMSLIFPEDLPGVMATLDRHIRSHGREPYYNEVRYRHKDGSTVWVICTGRVILWNDDGTPVRMVGCHIDITKRKQVEEELRKSEERWQFALEGTGDGVWDWDPATHTVFFSRQWQAMLGYRDGTGVSDSYEEWRGRIHPDDRERCRDEFARHCRGESPSYTCEYRIRCKDGSYKWVLDRGKAIERSPSGGPARVIGISSDITVRKLMEDRLLQMQKMNAIGQLAGGVAHDFNNQLVAILGYSDMLVHRLESGPLNQYARNIRTAATRSADLTKQLLAFSRKGKYLSVPVDVHKIIFETVAMLRRSIDARIEIRQHLDANAHEIIGDPTQIQNAILNLAVNARDAMPCGGLISIETSVACLEDDPSDPDIRAGCFLQIGVSDTGIGMDAETRSHIFEPFFTTKEQGKGTGLGLAAVHGTVKNHRGAIRVESEAGHGSTFTLFLPLAAPEALRQEAAPAMEPIHGDGHILIVDDERMALDLTADMLRDFGYQVTAYGSGEEALGFYRQSWDQVDLVILDLLMPHLTGRDVFRAMRQIDPKVKAMFVSGHSLEGEAQQILDDGVLAFMHKPFDRLELSLKIAQAMQMTAGGPLLSARR